MSNLSELGTVKYYKGYLNHAYSLNTINASKGSDLTFRIADAHDFQFKSYNSTDTAVNSTTLFTLGTNCGAKFFRPLTVVNDVTLNSTLTVVGTTQLNGHTYVNNSLTVTGETSISINGDVEINGVLSVNSNVYVGGDLSVAAAAVFNSNVTIHGTATLESDLIVNNCVTFNSTLSVGGVTFINNSLTVTGKATFNSTLTVNSDFTTNCTLYSNELSVANNILIEAGKLIIGDTVVMDKEGDAAVFYNSVDGMNSAHYALRQNNDGDTYVSATANNSVFIHGETFAVGDSSVNISKNVHISSTLSVAQQLQINNSLFVNSTATFSHDVLMNANGTLSVGGESLFSNDVYIAANKVLTVDGTSSVNQLTATSAHFTRVDVDTGYCNSLTVNSAWIDNLSIAGIAYAKSLTVHNCATFNSSVKVYGTLSVTGNATFNNDVTIDGDLSISANKTLSMNSNAKFVMHGANGNVSYDDFTMYNSNNGDFMMTYVGVDIDTENFAQDVATVNSTAIVFNSKALYLLGNNSLVLSTNNDTGHVCVESNLSVSGDTVMQGTLTVNSYLQINNSVIIKVENDKAMFSHVSNSTSTNYALNQDSSGDVRLNAKSGQSVKITNGDSTDLLTATENSVTIHKPVELEQTLSVSGVVRFSDNVSVGGNVTFGDSTTVVSDVNLGGNLSVGGYSLFSSSATFNGAVTANSIVTVNNNLTVTNSATFQSTLSVGGKVTVQNTLSVANSMTVGGDLSVQNNLFIGDGKFEYDDDNNQIKFGHKDATHKAVSQDSSGNTKINGAKTDLQVDGTDIVQVRSNSATITQAVTMDSTLDVTGNLDISGTATVGNLTMGSDDTHAYIGHDSATHKALRQDSDGDTIINGANDTTFKINNTDAMKIEDTQTTVYTNSFKAKNVEAETLTLSGSLSVGGASTFSGDVKVEGDLSVSERLIVNNTLTVNSNTTILGATTIYNSLTVNGDVTLNGDLLVKGTSTQVNIESTNVEFKDNAIVLAHNCNYSTNSTIADLHNIDSGLWIGTHGTDTTGIGFVYNNGNNHWITRGSDLGVAEGRKLVFKGDTDNTDWSMELDNEDTDNAEDSKDLVFRFNGDIKFRICAEGGDGDGDEEEENW